LADGHLEFFFAISAKSAALAILVFNSNAFFYVFSKKCRAHAVAIILSAYVSLIEIISKFTSKEIYIINN